MTRPLKPGDQMKNFAYVTFLGPLDAARMTLGSGWYVVRPRRGGIALYDGPFADDAEASKAALPQPISDEDPGRQVVAPISSMTPALKAMVEAMAAEMVRQRDAGELIPMHAAEISRRDGPDGRYASGDISSIYLMGRFDLEKVARAGLAALEPSPEMILAMHAAVKHQFDFSEAYARIWRAGRDAILKETP